METIGDRIRKIRRSLPEKTTQEKFGEMIGVKVDVITSYELNKSNPPEPTLRLICKVFGVKYDWLKTGDGDPYEQGIVPALVRALHNAPALEAALKRIVSRMTTDDWKALNAVIEKAISENEE